MAVPEIEIVEIVTDDPGAGGRDFAAFFREEYAGLVALATAVTGSRQAGEDIAAETMSRAYRRWDRVATYDKPGAWARRVAINLLHSRRRKLAAEVQARLRLGHRATDARAQPDRADAIAGADHFEQLLAPLAPRQRTAAALHYLHDLSVADIAEAMGCAEGTVKAHLHAARAAVAGTLEKRDEP